MNPWGQPQQPYNPAMAAYYQQQQQAAAYGYQQQQPYQQPQYQPVPGYPPQPQYPYCLLYTSPSPRDATLSRMPSSA